MANIKGKVKTLAMVKNVVNVKNCTNFGCMAIDGKKAWGLKTASGNEYSVVHYCSDVNDKVSLRYKDLLLVAKDDELGRKLQDLELTTRKRAPRNGGD